LFQYLKPIALPSGAPPAVMTIETTTSMRKHRILTHAVTTSVSP